MAAPKRMKLDNDDNEKLEIVQTFLLLQCPQLVFKNIFNRLPARERFRAASVCQTFQSMLACRDMYSDIETCNLNDVFLKSSCAEHVILSAYRPADKPTALDLFGRSAYLTDDKLRALDLFGPFVLSLTVRTDEEGLLILLPRFPRLEKLKLDLRCRNINIDSIVQRWTLPAASKFSVSDLDITCYGMNHRKFFMEALPGLLDVSNVRRFSTSSSMNKPTALTLGLDKYANLESLLICTGGPALEFGFGWHLIPANLRELYASVLPKNLPNLARFRRLEVLRLRIWIDSRTGPVLDVRPPVQMNPGRSFTRLSKILLNNARSLRVFGIRVYNNLTHNCPPAQLDENLLEALKLNHLRLEEFQLGHVMFKDVTDADLLLNSLCNGSGSSLKRLQFNTSSSRLVNHFNWGFQYILASKQLSCFVNLHSIEFSDDSWSWVPCQSILDFIASWPADRRRLSLKCVARECCDEAVTELKLKNILQEDSKSFKFDITFRNCCSCELRLEQEQEDESN